MKILRQMIEKKMDYYEESMVKKNYLRAISHFYGAYQLSLFILNKDLIGEQTRNRDKVYKKWLSIPGYNEKLFKRFYALIQEDLIIIITAIKYIEEEFEENPYEQGPEIDKPGYIGISSYELME